MKKKKTTQAEETAGTTTIGNATNLEPAGTTPTTVEPVMETAEPTNEPTAETTESNTMTAEANTVTAEPNMVTAEPNSMTAEPNTVTAEPNTVTASATDEAPPTLPRATALELLAGEKTLSTNEMETVGAMLQSILDEYDRGAISQQTLQALCHAANYERDIENARRQGEIDGRNLRIEEFLIEHRTAQQVRQLGCNHTDAKPTPPPSVIGGLSAADRLSIWERGHEKRVSHH